MNEEAIQYLVDKIRALPFSKFITSERLNEYFLASHERGEDLEWLVNRMDGFGASETGYLVTDLRNRTRKPVDDFVSGLKSARSVIAEKLLYKLQDTDNQDLQGALQRGKRMEDLIRTIFIDDLRAAGHNVERDTESLKILQNAPSHHSQYPWLKGKNLDDLLIVDGKRIIVDYKVPKEAGHNLIVENEGTLAYRVQVNQYEMFLKDKGIEVDGLCVAAFNFSDATVSAVWLDPEPELQNEIIEAGDTFWNDYVLRGRLPTIPQTYDTNFNPDDMPDAFFEQAARLAAFRAMEETIRNESTKISKSMTEALERNQFNAAVSFEFGAMSGSCKPVLEINEQALFEAAQRLSLDPEDPKYKKSIKRLHTAVLKEAKAQGVTLDENTLHSVTWNGSIRKASPSKPGSHLYQAILTDATQQVKNVAKSLTETQMSVLDVIRDTASAETAKQAYFANMNTHIQPQSELEVDLPLLAQALSESSNLKVEQPTASVEKDKSHQKLADQPIQSADDDSQEWGVDLTM